MSGALTKTGWGQKTVLHLEPKRAAATIRYSIMTLLAVGVVATAFLYPPDSWPEALQPNANIWDEQIRIAAGVAAFIALLFMAAAIANGRRWSMKPPRIRS